MDFAYRKFFRVSRHPLQMATNTKLLVLCWREKDLMKTMINVIGKGTWHKPQLSNFCCAS